MGNIFSVFGQAFLETAKMETAVNAFKRCGISPFNSNIFSASDFAVSTEGSSLTAEGASSTTSTHTDSADLSENEEALNTINILKKF